MTNPIRALRNRLTTDGPGHTDYPERDIAAHRANARLTRWIGYGIAALVLLMGAVGVAPRTIETMAFILFWIGLTQFLSVLFQVEALEWEVALLKEERDDD